MFFNSWEFLVFLLLVLALYYTLNTKWQNRLLLVASYFFYSWWDWRFSLLLALSTVVDYFLALVIHDEARPALRKRLLWVSIIVNFGMLGFFKYFDFFTGSAVHVLHWLGFRPDIRMLNIILPIGISFYTFQTVSYVVDVYRRQMTPTRDFLTYALFVSYFPHLVAGPITRAEMLIPQLLGKRTVSNQHINTGCLLILIGLLKKVAIADVLAPNVESYFLHPNLFSSEELLRGVYFFSFQIYCDFSGYADMACGVSRLFGIELPRNFEQPYLSKTVTEFWHRWNITLSSWLRDYLYIPLGGNRDGVLKTYRNLVITMLLGGLWHGANWTFVIWGFIHGMYLAVHKCILMWFPSVMERPRLGAMTVLLQIVFTFHLVSLTWIFFRAQDLSVAMEYLRGIICWHGPFQVYHLGRLFFFAGLVLALDWPQYRSGSRTVMLQWPWPVRGLVYVAIIMGLVLARTNNVFPFIYFQF